MGQFRMQGFVNRKRFTIALLCTVSAGISLPAHAQTMDGSSPSLEDENGVDLVTHQYSFPNTENAFAIGDLTFRHSVGLDPTVVKPDGYYSRMFLQAGGENYTGYANIDFGTGAIWIGHGTKYFEQPDYKTKKWISADGDGSYIAFTGTSASTNEYIYYAADGTKYHYKTYMASNMYSDFILSQIEYTDGRIITITNRTSTSNGWVSVAGPQTITSNRGYMLQFEYQSDTATDSGYSKISAVNGYNLGLDTCADGALHCTQVTGRPRTTFTYGTNSLTEVNPAGKTSQFYTTTESNLTLLHIRLPDGYAGNYDNNYVRWNGTNVSHVMKGGKTWSYQWNYTSANPSLNDVVDPNGNYKTYGVYTDASFSFRNRITRISTDDSSVSTSYLYTYDDNSRVSKVVVSATQQTIQFTRDANGNVTERREISGTAGTPADIVSTAVFPTTCSSNLLLCHLPTSVTDPLNNTTNFTYAANGQMLTKTLPAATTGGIRPKVTNTYTSQQAYYKNSSGSIVASGLPISLLTSTSTCLTSASCSGTAQEAKTTISYGPQTAGTANSLAPAIVTRSSGDNAIVATTSMTYDAAGNVASVDGPLAGSDDTTVFRYDVMGRELGSIGPDPDGSGTRPNAAIRKTYDNNGRVTLVEQGYTSGQTATAWDGFVAGPSVATTYDAYGRATSQKLQNGTTVFGVTQYAYDLGSRLSCIAVRMDPTVWASQTNACTPQTTASNGPDRITKYTYDFADRVTLVQEGYGSTAQANVRAAAYTRDGHVSYVTDAKSNRTTYSYDGHGRLVKTQFPVATAGSNSSSTTDYEELTYGDNVHVTQRRLRDAATVSYSYDNLGRITAVGGSTVADRTYSYNLLGMQTAGALTTGGQSIANTYDALGRITSEVTPQGTVSYQYDAASRRTRITWPDGYYATYDYDLAGNVTAIRENGATSGAGVLASYTYDAWGRRLGVSYGNGTSRSYAYDNVDRLTGLSIDLAGTANDLVIGAVGSTGSAVTYNPASQVTGVTRSNDAYAWTGHYNFDRAYTTNGLNQYTVSGATGLGYDARGNLTTSGSTTYAYNGLNELTSVSGGPSATLQYDPAGRLYELSAGSATARFLYDGVTMIGEYNGSNALQRRFVPGPGTDEPLVWYEGAGTTDRRWMQADEHGSVTAVSDSSGAALAVNRYDEYGIPQSTNLGRSQYTGQVWLSEIGLYYYKARFYSPTLGRFMQTDPIGYGDGMNLYAYTGNDPVNSSDPSGLCSKNDPSDCDLITSGTSSGGSSTTSNNGGASWIYSGLTSFSSSQGLYISPRRVWPILFTGIDVAKAQQQSGSWLRRTYRWFNPDVCAGQGTNEGGGASAGYSPYMVNEPGSLTELYGHVFPRHGYGTTSGASEFAKKFSQPNYLIGAILSIIQTQPEKGSNDTAIYTVNTGQYAGYDNRHGGGTDYITVIMGPDVNGARTLVTSYPGCR